MKQRNLGSEGLTVSIQGLGCMSMSKGRSAVQEAEAIATIHRALELGVNFLDTADVYGMGHNEELVGKAIEGQRNRVIVATKFGNILESDGSFRRIDGRPEYVKSACEASLRRLNVEVIDLYYLHRVDITVPIEDTVGAMSKLVDEGKIRFLGLSEVAPGTLRRAHAVHPITALQTEYSLWTRDIEDEILPTCRTLGIGFVSYSPLGRGFLTGRFRSPQDLAPDDRRLTSPRFQGENFHRNLELVNQISVLAKEKQCTLAQLALAWVLVQGADVVPIPGTRRTKHLEENVAANRVELSKEDLKRLDEIAPNDVAVGERYPEDIMSRVNL